MLTTQRSTSTLTLLLGAIGGFLGGLLPAVFILTAIFVLGLRLDLSTGFPSIDSMLYSISGPISIILVAIYWSVVGAIVGATFGIVMGVIAGVLSRTR